jgi:hypothetical protein
VLHVSTVALGGDVSLVAECPELVRTADYSRARVSVGWPTVAGPACSGVS